MAGPHGRRSMQPRPKVKDAKSTFKRLIGVIFKKYKVHLIIVFVCIIVSVLANVQGTMFIQKLIDDYITPLVNTVANGGEADFSDLLFAIIMVAAFYLIGAAATFAYSKIMVYVTQGTMKDLRCQIFEHMESLPIKYFDTHKHGDIMSVYTNDVDTLRQMISQSMPQLFSSMITIVAVLVSMIMLSIPLTVVTLAMVGVMLLVTKKIASKSGDYFIAQQKDLGAENGYIEEMMKGQKVVKVFNHEQKSIEEFKELNDKLFDSSYNANKFANILMPVNAQLGNVSYVLCAIAGCLLFVMSGGIWITLGRIVSFLSFNRSFIMPINQLSQQINSIAMALAGAERIFELLGRQALRDRKAHRRMGVEARSPGYGRGRVQAAGGRACYESCRLRLYRRQACSPRRRPVRKARSEDRLCRFDRRGQDHDNQPDKPFLRYSGRQDTLRRYQYQ